jgi:hypothetical protein
MTKTPEEIAADIVGHVGHDALRQRLAKALRAYGRRERLDEANKWWANWNVDDAFRDFEIWAKQRIRELEADDG